MGVKLNELYKCSICGNVVSVVYEGGADLVCCEKTMDILEARTGEEEGKEKHVPVIETIEGGIKVKVGSVVHPMDDDHFIGLIQVMKGNEVVVGKRLKSGDEPVAEFCLANVEDLSARIFCNKHGVWKS